MSDSPRRNAQANRQARRTQPYARPGGAAESPAQSTPSRLRSLLSYVSPFRSSRKAKEPSPDLGTADADQMNDDDELIKADHDSADDEAQFALHGKQWNRLGELNQNAPPSPSPGTGSTLPRSIGSSLASSVTMPNLAAFAGGSSAGPSASSGLTTPRFPGALRRSPSHARYADVQSAHAVESAVASSSSHATQELARFFQAKAERGEDSLNAVEQAGVLQLMQRAQAESALPTAFTPNFRSTQSISRPQPASEVASSAGSVFSAGTPSVAGSAIPPSAAKRRRPVYVGAGYSSRRRRTTLGGALASSQSESVLSSLSGFGGSGLKDKRRRVGAEREDEEEIPVATLDDILASPARTVVPDSGARPLYSPAAKPKLAHASALPHLGGTGPSGAANTPAKPSPLWQVSAQPEAATPSPARRPLGSETVAPASATRAADLVLEVIRQEDEARRKALPASAKATKSKTDAILNPYAAEENPLAFASRAAQKEKPKNASPKPKQRVSKIVAEVEKLKETEPSPLEQLERTMPAEYRREAKRAKPASPPPAPKAAPEPAKVKKPVAIMTLSSDNEDEDGDEEMGTGDDAEHGDEDEDEDQLEEDEEGDDDEDDEEDEQGSDPLPAPAGAFTVGGKSKAPEPAKSAFTFSTSAAQPPSTTTPFAFGSSSSSASAPKPAFSFTPKPPAPASETSADGAEALLALSGGAAPQRSLTPAEANIPPRPPVFPSFAHPVATTKEDGEALSDPKAAARALNKAQLPISRFSFGGFLPPSSTQHGDDDMARKAVKDLVKAMGKGELPTFAF